MNRANLLPIALVAVSVLFAFLAWQAPMKSLPTTSLASFPQCLHIRPEPGENRSDMLWQIQQCYQPLLQKWQFKFAPRLSIYQSLVEIAEGFAVAAAIVSIPWGRIKFGNSSLTAQRGARFILGAAISVGLGLFGSIEFENVLYAYTGWRWVILAFHWSGWSDQPELVAGFGLLACTLCVSALAGTRKGIFFGSSMVAVAQFALLFFDAKEMYLSLMASLNGFGYPAGEITNGLGNLNPVGVAFVSNWFVLIVSFFLVYALIETGRNPGHVRVPSF